MKNILVMVTTGVGLFVATVFGLLAAQGRLDYEGTKNIPLLNSMFSKPTEDSNKDPKSADGKPSSAAGKTGDQTDQNKGSGSSDPKSGQGKPKKKRIPYRRGRSVLSGSAGNAAKQNQGEGSEASADSNQDQGKDGDNKDQGKGVSEAEREWAMERAELERRHPYPRGLFDFADIKADITPDEFNDMVRRVKQKEKQLVEMEAALNQKRRDIETQMRDVRYRQAEVARQMQTVVQERAKLDMRIEEFHKKVLLVKQDELEGLKENARNIANLDPEIGRDLILSWWNRGPDGQARAVKTLSLMSKEAVEVILGTMETDKIREILDKRLTLARTQEDRGKK